MTHFLLLLVMTVIIGKKADLAEKYKHVSAIFYNNDISTVDDSKCLFLTLALLNHSCASNSSWARGGEDPRVLELRAIKNIKAGEEVSVNYISVEGRYSSRNDRQQRLFEGWGFKCICPLCESGLEEDIKLRIRAIQEEMRDKCNTCVDEIDWMSLAECQVNVVDLVSQLSTAPLLLPRECQSLANLGQLARNRHFKEKALELWKEILMKRRVKQAMIQFKKIENLFDDWKKTFDRKLRPDEEEIEKFLWLM